MAMTPEVFALSDEHRAVLARLTAEQTTQLTRSWVTLWDELQTDLGVAVDKTLAAAEKGRIAYAAAARQRHIPRVLELVRERVDALTEDAMDTVAGEADTAAKLGAYHQGELITAQLPAGQTTLTAGFGRVPVEALDAIILRTTEQIHSRRWPLSDSMVREMKAELTRGVALGENPRRTAANIMKRTEGRFAGGLTRALTIARTEMLDAHRAGAQATDKANADVMDQWIWLASLSGRTCPACLAQHGTSHDIDEAGPEGHQNCRCSRMPRTKTWRELGFDIDEPRSAVPDAGEWFENLTEDSQRSILGKGRYEAWTDGRYPMSDWSVKRQNDGWRDSWVVSPIPK